MPDLERCRGVRQQAEVAGALDGLGDHALLAGVEAGLLAALDLAVGREEASEVFGLLVVAVGGPVGGLEDDI